MCWAEQLYSEGFRELNLDKLELASSVFPFDQRYRKGSAELVVNWPSDAVTVDILGHAIIRDPNELWLWEAMLMHSVRRGDKDAADNALRNLYRIAPQSEFVKAILARRREP